LLPRSDGANWGRATGARARCVHTLEKGHCKSVSQSHNWSTQEAQGQSAREEGERVLQQHSRACTWPRHSRTRASGKQSLSPCLEQLQHAAETRGVSPLSQLRRCVRGAARCCQCVQDSSSFNGGGGCCSMVRPNRTTSHCHPMHSLCWRKQLLHAMWLGLQWCPSREQQASVSSTLSFTLFRLLGN
jgi:hypothetical protein